MPSPPSWNHHEHLASSRLASAESFASRARAGARDERASRIHARSARGSATRIGCSNSRAMRGDGTGWTMAVRILKLGMRGLMRAPAFAITAVLILTFGIGLNLTLYQMASVGLLRPPDITSPETLARFKRRFAGNQRSRACHIRWRELVAQREHRAVGGAAREPRRRGVGQGVMGPSRACSSRPTGLRNSAGRRPQGRLFAEGDRHHRVSAGRRGQRISSGGRGSARIRTSSAAPWTSIACR